MDEKLQTIYNITQQIREIVDDECIPLEDLPEAIKDKLREGGSGGSGFTTAFVFSSTNSIAPTSEKMDMSTGLVENLDEGWSQTNNTDADHLYMSYAIFDGWGDIQHTWASPVDLNGKNGSVGPKGEKGDKGDLGPQGPAGVDGQDGKDGIDGSTYEYVYFRGLTEDDKPINIPSGEGNNQDDYKPTYTKTVEINGVQTTLKWEDRAQGVSSTFKYEWRSERSKKDTSTWNDFTEPILWAKYGEKGKDGDGVQYIFTITKEFDAPNHPYPTGWETDPEYQNNESDEYIPKPVDGQIWKDDPIEVDDINRYCWVSVRKYRNGKWGRYSNPTLWTKWTESSGVITGDVIVLDVDPNWVMLNEDENEVKTTVTAYRGSDKVVIQNITCDEGGFTFTPEYNESKTEWYLTFSNIEATNSNTHIKLNIVLSDDDVRTKTFTIYHTKFSAETVTLDFKDDNILVPCSDGSTPDSGFFNNFLVPMVMRVNGEEKTIVNIAPNNSTYNDLFELVDDGKSLQVKGFPGSGSTNTIDFTAKDADNNSASASLRFTKFNTAGGELVMYTLNVNASDIVADQRNDTYTVYTWQENDHSNIIKVNVNKYSSSNSSKVINLKDLDSNYKVFYANDPYDWAEDELDEEWRIMSDSGLYIGTTDIDGVPGIAPDSCVAFQLRHWVNTTKAINWENCTEDDYEIQDAEILKVDIIQEIASYKFVINPTFFHKRVNGTIDPAEIQIGLSKNVAGDGGNSEYIPINKIPFGYDLYYEINGTQTKIHGEDEQGSLPCNIPISNTNGDINLYLVTNEHSDDEGKVVLSETIEMRSELSGEPAYIGFLAPPVGIVRCDADGNPDTNHPQLTTKFFVTNAKSVSVNKPTVLGCNVSVSGDEITFKDFNNNLSQNTIVTITANYTDANDIPASTRAKYQIIKNNNAKSTIVTQLSNPSAIVQLIDNTFLQKTVSTKIQARKGEEFAQITDINIKSVKLDGNIISLSSNYPVSMSCELDKSHPFEDNTIEFTLSDNVSKLSIGEHIITVDLNIVINGLNYIETQTILIQKSGGENAVHLELTNDREYVTGNNLNCETLARLYDGYAPAMGVTYSADFGDKLIGTINSESGVLQVTGVTTDVTNLLFLDEDITISADYKNNTYKKTFNVKYSNSNWRLLITPSVINIDEPEGLKITMKEGSNLVTSTYGDIEYTYRVDDGEPVLFDMPLGTYTIDKSNFSSIKNKLVVSAKIEENGKVTILDEETVGVVRDGENAQYYQIDANHRWIVKNSDGVVVTPTGAIKPIFQKINGSELISRSFDELTHDGYYVCKSINGEFNATRLTENTLSTIPSLVNTQLVYYLFKNSVTQPSAESGWDDYVEIDVTATEKGDPGESGNNAPIIYPAGVWGEEKAYKVEVNRVPYVFYAEDDTYYMLNHEYLFKAEGESEWRGSNSAPGKTFEDEPIWLPIDSFEAIYADIGLFNQALVGKWVFHGDYMFSQEGVLGYYTDDSNKKYELYVPSGTGLGTQTGGTCSYEVALNPRLGQYSGSEYNLTIRSMNLWEKIHNGVWIPNSFFNAKNGEGWFAGKKIQFNSDGSGILGDGLVWTSDGTVTIKKPHLYDTLECMLGNSVNLTDLNYKNVLIRENEDIRDNPLFDQYITLNTGTINSNLYFKLTNTTNNIVVVYLNDIQVFGIKFEETKLVTDLDRILLCPKSSINCSINKENQIRLYIEQQMFSTTHNGYECLINTPTINAVSIKNSPMLNRCVETLYNGSILAASGCNFDRFIFNSSINTDFYYVIRDNNGDIVSSSYNEKISATKWTILDCNPGSDFQFYLYVKDPDKFLEEGTSCDTQIMFAKNSLFGGVYNAGCSFKGDTLSTFGWQSSLENYKLIQGEVSVPGSIVKINIKPSSSNRVITDNNHNINPIELQDQYYNDVPKRLYITTSDRYEDQVRSRPDRFVSWWWKRYNTSENDWVYDDYMSSNTDNDDGDSYSHVFKEPSADSRIINVTIDASYDKKKETVFTTTYYYDVAFFGYDQNDNLVSTMRLACCTSPHRVLDHKSE